MSQCAPISYYMTRDDIMKFTLVTPVADVTLSLIHIFDAGMKRVGVMGFAYCISAFMDCTIAASRGLGKTVVPDVYKRQT